MSSSNQSKTKRDEILDHAWELISQKGAEVSMGDIATAAQVSRQAVYMHFGTRGGLLMSLVKRADDRFHIREDIFAAMESNSPYERLRNVLSAWFAFVRKILPVAKELTRLRDTDADAAAAWDDRMNDLRSWLRTLIESLADDGALRDEWSIDKATDYLWAISSVHIWRLLVVECCWEETEAETTLRNTIILTLIKG